MQPPAVFQEYLFCLPVECHQFLFSLPNTFSRPSWKFQDPDPLTFDLWRHNWGHVRRKMCSVAHNLQASPFLLVIWILHEYYLGHVVPSSTQAFHRSSGPTQVNRGQLRSNEVNDLCRLFRILLLSKVIWGADFESDIHFTLRDLKWDHGTTESSKVNDVIWPENDFLIFDP